MQTLDQPLKNSVIKYQKKYVAVKLPYFVSEIMQSLAIDDNEEIDAILIRAFNTYNILQLPIKLNFKKVFRCDGKMLFSDWKISKLASYLIIINCNPNNVLVAKAQLYFALRNTNH